MSFIQYPICALIFVLALSARTNADPAMTNEMDTMEEMEEGGVASENGDTETRLESFIDATIMKALQDKDMTAANVDQDNMDAAAAVMEYDNTGENMDDMSSKEGEEENIVEKDANLQMGDEVANEQGKGLGAYRQIHGGLSHITASTNYLWGVNPGHQIFKCCRPCTGKWVHVHGHLKQIDASDDEVWGVNKFDQIYKRPVDGSGGWRRIPGCLKHVSASGNGYIWGVNKHDQIFKCKKPCTGQWQGVPGRLKQIDGGERYVYGVNSANNVYTRPVDGRGGWKCVGGPKLKHVTASGATSVYGVDIHDRVYSCPKPCYRNFKQIGGLLSQVDGAFDSFAGVNKHCAIFVRTTGL